MAPAQQEILTSWLHRQATVHGLAAAELRHHLRIGARVSDDPGEVRELAGRLAAVTGHPPDRLARAVPELRVPMPDWAALRHVAQRGCPRCTARHQGAAVRCLFAHHEYLCTRHGYWIGPPDPTRDDAPSRLAAWLPELVAAQRRLRHAERRHGWAATFDATATATAICVDLRFSGEGGPLWTCWQRRLDLLMPAGYRRSLFIAAIFPEVGALAAVLAATGAHAPALVDASGVDRVVSGAERAMGGAIASDEIGSVLAARLTTRTSGQRFEPAAIYPQTSHHDDGTPRVTDMQRQAEQATANRFARDRRAPRSHRWAAPLPYAHRPAASSPAAGRSR